MRRLGPYVLFAAFLAVPFPAPQAAGTADATAPPELIVWQGTIEVNESIVFNADQTLVISPGTTVLIRTVAPSCTEGTAPVMTVAGDLVADGNDTARIRFVSVTADGEICTAGREAVLVYAGPNPRNQSISNSDFIGGTLACYQAAIPLLDCTFKNTQARFSGDRSVVERCTFLDSPLTVFPGSSTVIANCTFGRTEKDDSGIYLFDRATVRGNTITGCVSGVEASIWVEGTVTGNSITGCLEAINSTGALDIVGNSITGNGVGIRSWAGLDRLDGNLIAENDLGIASLGRLAVMVGNTFRSPSGAANRIADIQEMVLASGVCVDGNGQTIGVPVTIRDSTGRTVFFGDPEFVPLTAYRRMPDGTERRYSPFLANATSGSVSNSTVLDGTYNVSFSLRLDLYPELTVESFWGPASAAGPGGTAPMTITVRNTGNVPARNFRVAASVDGQPAFLQHVNSLEPGQARNLTFEWPVTAGRHMFVAVADPALTVSEPSEADNTRAFSADIRGRAPAMDVPAVMPLVMLALLVISIPVLGKRK